MSALPPFVVLIPTKNRPQDLARTLASLYAMTVRPKAVVLVDQSGDERSRMVALSAAAAAGQSSELHYFHAPELAGVAAARNYAMARARTLPAHAEVDLIWLFLDDDVEMEPDFAAELLATYQRDATIAGVSGAVTNYPAPPRLARAWQRVFHRGPFYDPRPFIYWKANREREDTLHPVRYFTGALMSFRARLLADYDYDDPRPGCPRDEDIGFCEGIRARLPEGARLVINPRARLAHHRSPVACSRQDWLAAEVEGTRQAYRRHWRRGPVSRLSYGWLRCGLGLLRARAAVRQGGWRRVGGIWPWLLLPALWIALYAPVMAGLVRQWWQDPNYGHGFLVPVVSGYLLWRSRARWRKLALRPSLAGGAVMVFAALLLLAGRLAAELFLARISLLIGLGGAVVFFAGWRWLRAWAFPFGFLFLMIPLPAVIYYQITFPLQLWASRLAGSGLDLLQIPALREGNTILLPNYTMAVAEACSGIRSLFSLVTLAVAYAYFTEPRIARRAALAACMVPIAIVANGLRILGTGVIAYDWNPRYAEGFFHAFSGWLIFVVSLGLMVLVHAGLSRVGRRRPAPSRARAAAAAAQRFTPEEQLCKEQA